MMSKFEEIMQNELNRLHKDIKETDNKLKSKHIETLDDSHSLV